MTEQLKYRAKIKARGLDTTGVTEDHARKMAATLGGHTMFIVEAIHDTTVLDAEGNQQVTLRLTAVEPVPEAQEDAVREFQRALYRQRPEVQGQETLQGVAPGPSVADAAGQLSSQIERDDDGSPTGVWDGDPDGPLVTEAGAPAGSAEVKIPGKAAKKAAAPLAAVPDPTCGYPDCTKAEGHEGDHGWADADATDADES